MTAAPRAATTARSSANGNLYCPQTPRAADRNSGRSPAPPPKSRPRTTTARPAELARYKLGRLTADDPDGYHRVQCPAAMGKIRCPLRPASMTLDRDRPEILQPPEHPQACCAQQTITVPPDVLAKTAIAVGTALAGGPPRRSQRALLTHWAPASGAKRRSVRRGRGAGCLGRQPPRREIGSSGSSSDAAPRGCGSPEPRASAGSPGVRKARTARMLPGTRVVGHVAAYHAGQSPPLLRDGLVPGAARSWSLTSFSFARIRFEMVIRLTWNVLPCVFPQMCVKPRKSNVSGFPAPRFCRFAVGEPPELDQPRLARVQLQGEPREPLAEIPSGTAWRLLDARTRR